MRLRRSQQAIDRSNASIDRTDVFLLTRLVDTLSVEELVDIAPCEPAETMRRIAGLAELELLEVLSGHSERPLSMRAQRGFDVGDEAVTLRPPPARALAGDEVPTLWPKKPATLSLDLTGFDDVPQTGVRMIAAPKRQPLAHPRIDRRKA